MRKHLLTFALVLPILANTANSQPITFDASSSNGLITKFQKLSLQQLQDTAKYYTNKNSTDTALICYSLIINSTVNDTTVKYQKRIIDALNASAVIYGYMCDYYTAYQYLLKALLLCEKYNFNPSRIYCNIGTIYARFEKYDIAKQYCSKALTTCLDSISMAIDFCNIGAIEVASGNLDSAFYFLNVALQFSNRHNNTILSNVLNNLASYHEKKQRYDSAYHYYQQALNEARKNKKNESEALSLYYLGDLFLNRNKIDSALYYINLSNKLALEYHFLSIQSNNYLRLSQIEEAKGRNKSALTYFKKCAALKDSVFNSETFGNINQMQRLYEVSKTNQQIEQLAFEKRINERTIRYRTIIMFIALGVLFFVIVVLLLLFLQNRRLNTAYKSLVEKNLEIMALEEQVPEKYKGLTLAQDTQDALIKKILSIMEDTSIICDTEFSVDKLTVLTQSNYTYVSRVIKMKLNKNFNALLNSYRIREAQRLLSEPDAAKYTIEAVALKVGFKSKSAFYEAFKKVTGVSPNFYLKSIQSMIGD